MTYIVFEVGVILMLIVANGAFAMSELAIVSARKTRLRQAAESGDAGSRIALDLAENPNRFLSTVQVGITVVGTLAGVYGGATIAKHLAEYLRLVPALAPHAEGIGLAVMVVSISYLSLIFGELAPKRLALSNPERIAAVVARPLRLLSILVVPLIRFLGWSTELVLRAFGAREMRSTAVSEEEIQLLVRESAEAGAIEAAERDMVRRVFRLNDYPARVLMTPRMDMVWVDVNEPIESLRRKVLESPHSRFPVCDGSPDEVLGVVQAKDLLGHDLVGRPLDIRGLVRVPLFVFEGMTGSRVLEQFRASGMPMAIVLDEYGSVEGLLTLNDILEALVGDIPEPGDSPDSRAIQRADGSWLIDGTLPIAELRDRVSLPPLPAGDYGTLAGFVLLKLGRIPNIADRFDWAGHTFEVVDMDGNRIDRVLISELSARTDDHDPQAMRC